MSKFEHDLFDNKHFMSGGFKSIFRIISLFILGLLGVVLLGSGLWFAFQGGPIAGVLMVVSAGGMLAGCAWWLLFLAPPQAELPHVTTVASTPIHGLSAPAPEPIQTVIRHQRSVEQTTEQLATPEELRAALRGIGLMRIAGSSWQEAACDERWANFCVYLHCERDKLDSSPDDVDGLYLTREDAEAAAAASPQAANSRVWKVFVATVRLSSVIEDRKTMHHLVSAIKRELLTLPDCPGTPVSLKGWSRDDKKAWLDASGQNIVLFEDENALDGPMYKKSEQTGEFRTDDGAGLFDYTGAVIVPPHYEEVEYFYGDLAAAKLNGRWGFIDRNAQWQIEAQYLELGRMSFYRGEGDSAYVRTEQGWGVIDRQGREIVKPAWDTLESGPDKSFRVTRDGKCGYINAAGVCVAGFQAEPYWLAENNALPADALVLHHPDKWTDLFALADRDGRRLTEFEFVRLSRPSEGFVVAEVKLEDESTPCGFLDFTGTWVIPPRFKNAYPFSDGFAQVQTDDRQWGYINRQGEVVIACQFEDAYPFREGLAAVQTGKYSERHYGFIDVGGSWVIQPKFDEVGNVFNQGLAAVRLDGLWGYIGRDGNWAIAPAYSRVWPFSEAGHACVCARVRNDDWFGMIDRAGHWLLPPSYNGIRDARQVECGNTGLQWIAAALDTNSRWGGVVLSTSEANRKIVVPFECYSSDEVFRVLEHRRPLIGVSCEPVLTGVHK